MRYKTGKVLVAFVMLITMLLTACSANLKIDELDIDRDEYPDWFCSLWKEDDFEYLYVRYGQKSNDPFEKMSYMVFRSSSDAKKYYKEWYDYCRSSGSDRLDHGANWFITRVPNTYDVVINAMYYRDKNVIIYAEVDITTYSTLGDSHSRSNPELRQYVLSNHSSIRRTVLGMLSKRTQEE